MSAFATEPVVVDIDMAIIDGVLERVRGALGDDDHACLQSVVHTLADLMRLVRERGTTIQRLRRLFGLAVSEKTIDVVGHDATTATPDASAADGTTTSSDGATDTATSNEPAAPPAKKPPKGHGRTPGSEYVNAERSAALHPTLHVGDICPGCARGKLYGLADPATTLRVFGQSPLVARAWELARLRCSGCGNVFTAPEPEEAKGPKYDASAVAMMALLRYSAGMPLHRLDRLQDDLGTPVPASTQWEVVRDHLPAVEPAWLALCFLAAQGNVLHNDDTNVRILSLMGKRRAELLAAGALPRPDRTGLFTTAIVATTDAGPIALFFSGRQHAGENLGDLLDGRDRELPPPIQMADGLDRNVPSEHTTIESNCLAHGRRHVVDEANNFPSECRHVLTELAEVFKHEAFCVKEGLSVDERLAFHQAKSAPITSALEKWMKAELDERRVEPNSGLGQAFHYLLKRWDKLTLFLRVPGAPIENNAVERILKAAIRHRNNSLFYKTERGARVGDLFMSLIHTAQLHGENPFEYLVALLRHEHEVAAAPGEWLPWNFRTALAAAARNVHV